MRPKSIFIVGELNQDSLAKFLEAFYKADNKPGPIIIYIFSDGGEVDVGMAIYELMRTSANPIITYGIGAVSSMAVLLLMGGDHRILTQNSNLLIHDGSVVLQGNLTSAISHMEQNVKMHHWYCQQIAERSGITIEKALELAGRESFLTADEALALNLVDEVKQYRDFISLEEEEDDGTEAVPCCPCSTRAK